MLGGDAACHHIANCGGMACQKNGITQHITKQPDGQRRTEPRPWVRCVRFVEVRTTGFRYARGQTGDRFTGREQHDCKNNGCLATASRLKKNYDDKVLYVVVNVTACRRQCSPRTLKSRCNRPLLAQKPEVVTVSKSRLGGKFKISDGPI